MFWKGIVMKSSKQSVSRLRTQSFDQSSVSHSGESAGQSVRHCGGQWVAASETVNELVSTSVLVSDKVN